jgi:hypothetical protein
MSELLKKTVALLPEILPKNAKPMMQRIVDAMQSAIAADPRFGASSYRSLLLKMSSDDLVREFDLAIRESMSAIQKVSGGPGLSALGLGLSIEPLDAAEAPSDTDFLSSTALFEKLCAKASSLGVDRLGAYSKDTFLASLNEAFSKSRIEPAEAKTMMPLARQALNGELAKLYEKLDSL